LTENSKGSPPAVPNFIDLTKQKQIKHLYKVPWDHRKAETTKERRLSIKGH
jgi:hypothetical protein